MSTESTLRGRVVTATADITDGVVAYDGGVLTYVGPASEFPGLLEPGLLEPSEGVTAGGAGRIIIPGLVDLHCHGALGTDFSEGSPEGARSASRYLHSRGATTLVASLVTGTPEDLVRNVKNLRTLTDEGLIAGSHLEGPFLSEAQCGAHDPALLLAPDAGLMAGLLDAAGPSLASVTLAAELPGASALVELLTAHGVIPSLGHTAADSPTAADFLAKAAAGLASAGHESAGQGNGRRRPTVTHLFNAMPSLHHRAPGPVSASLAAARAGEAVVELIADGVHLAPQTVKLVFDLVGAGNIALVTDSMAATGLQDGHYRLGSLAVTVDRGVARVDSSGSIAGGTATLLDVVRCAVAAGVDLQDAVASATAVPASVLGLSALAGDLRAGMPADVVVLSRELDLEAVLRRGEILPRPEAA
ncbi:N-acetylglucosamine-6-phosphate deacetylase [Pseudarthrobacter sp. NPDC092439]|uniref:N-acetylglucosamine-6-phosphate deacetylase n=1 Tax=unclassified Pseudarthrobacter TaxID=2647000 RepID=UPI0037FE3EB7